MSAIKVRAGELLPNAEAVAKARGAPFDLTQFTSIEFRMRDRSGNLIASGPAVGTTDGRLVYEWQPGDTDVAGTYRAVFVGIIGIIQQTMPTIGYITVRIAPP